MWETRSPRSGWQQIGSLLIPLLGLQMAAVFSTCLPGLFCACVPTPGVHIPSQQDTSEIELEPVLRASFDLHPLFKGPVSKHGHIPKFWRRGAQHRTWGWGDRHATSRYRQVTL